jgi:hypothetical protein
MHVIPTTQEAAEVRRIVVQRQLEGNSLQDPILKNPIKKKKRLAEWFKW